MSTASTHPTTADSRPGGAAVAPGTAGLGRPEPRRTEPRRTPFWAAVGTVAAREMKVKGTSKPFIITTLLLVAAALAATLLVPRLGDLFAGDGTSVGVVEQTAPAVVSLGEDYDARTLG